jgi:acyl-CoA thioesterase
MIARSLRQAGEKGNACSQDQSQIGGCFWQASSSKGEKNFKLGRALQNFDEVLAAIAPHGSNYTVNPADDWRQGRTLFGGLSAALCLAACERMVPDLGLLRAGQIAFIGPSAGEATLVPSILRRGKSVTFMGCDLIADGKLATRAIFTFGVERETPVRGLAPRASDVPKPDDCASLFGKHKPAFTVHLDQRLAGGERPGSGADKGDMLVWVRHCPDVAPSKPALVALGDALPPASFPRLTGPAIISTMTWAFDLFDPAAHHGTGWHLIRSTDDGVDHGYAGQNMGVWDESGAPIMIARQSVAIFA